MNLPIRITAVFAALWLSACVQAPVATLPPKPTETSVPISVRDPEALKAKVTSIAQADLCSQSVHGEQGKPPKSFMKGIALSYARAVCDSQRPDVLIASRPVGDANQDALAHYGVSPATPEARLQAVYSMLVGSAARESSWRWCVGKDPGASNTSAETCEAGLYQTSYNSRSQSAVLPQLFQSYKSNQSGCFAAEYKGASTCSDANMKNWGTGEGVEFQRLSKECPGFASEYHAVMVRVNRKHYGPINTKQTELKAVCTQMFARLYDAIKGDPDICLAIR